MPQCALMRVVCMVNWLKYGMNWQFLKDCEFVKIHFSNCRDSLEWSFKLGKNFVRPSLDPCSIKFTEFRFRHFKHCKPDLLINTLPRTIFMRGSCSKTIESGLIALGLNCLKTSPLTSSLWVSFKPQNS